VRSLYYDCFSGISGDMNLGAMLDLGVDPQHLISELKKLDIGPYEIIIGKEQRKGITGTRVEVVVPPESQTEERRFQDIVSIIEQSSLSEKVKDLSIKIFRKLAEAEAKVHGHSVEEVHFHEVGAVDSIVDVVGAAVCLDFLDVKNIIASPVQLGGGFVKCRHGIFPVPAPATAEILKGIPVRTGAVPFETATPTGAGILAATAQKFTDKLEFKRRGSGTASEAGTRTSQCLRVFLGEATGLKALTMSRGGRPFSLMQYPTTGSELYDSVMDELFEKGAGMFISRDHHEEIRPA